MSRFVSLGHDYQSTASARPCIERVFYTLHILLYVRPSVQLWSHIVVSTTSQLPLQEFISLRVQSKQDHLMELFDLRLYSDFLLKLLKYRPKKCNLVCGLRHLSGFCKCHILSNIGRSYDKTRQISHWQTLIGIMNLGTLIGQK